MDLFYHPLFWLGIISFAYWAQLKGIHGGDTVGHLIVMLFVIVCDLVGVATKQVSSGSDIAYNSDVATLGHLLVRFVIVEFVLLPFLLLAKRQSWIFAGYPLRRCP